MSMFSIMDIASSGASAQQVRLNTIASNLANAESGDGNPDNVYRAKRVVFQAELSRSLDGSNSGYGIQIKEIVNSDDPLQMVYEPNHPKANNEGYVYYPNVNKIEEMANMMSTSRTFQNNINAANTTKTLMQKTLAMGQQ